MKYKGDYTTLTITQTGLGQLLNLTPGRINQLITEKIVVRDENKKGEVFLVESLKNYYQSKHSYSDDKGKAVNYWTEKGLHERAKRKMAELKLRKAEGELYEAAAVESLMTELLVNFRNKLLGVPSKLSPQLVGKTVEKINQILTEEIYDDLTELADGLENANFEDDAEINDTEI